MTVSEFVRNELLFKGEWVGHFSSLGLRFQTLPLNGVLWMVWSFLLAYLVYSLQFVFSFWKTVLLSWMPSFLMMWITIYNLQVLPLSLLWYAVPLSLFEVIVALLILQRFRVVR